MARFKWRRASLVNSSIFRQTAPIDDLERHLLSALHFKGHFERNLSRLAPAQEH